MPYELKIQYLVNIKYMSSMIDIRAGCPLDRSTELSMLSGPNCQGPNIDP